MSKKAVRRKEQQERRITNWCKTPAQAARVRALAADGWKLEFRVGHPDPTDPAVIRDTLFLRRREGEACGVDETGQVHSSKECD
jgi:hypothetical protein